MKSIQIVSLLWFFSSSLLASREFLVAPDGRHFPVEGEAKPILRKPDRNPAVRDSGLIAAPGDFDPPWRVSCTHYSFGFSTGDSMAIRITPLAAAIVKGIAIYNADFTGEFCFFLHDDFYDPAGVSKACADANGWIGYWAHVEDGDTVDSDPGESEFWLRGDNECFNNPPVGKELWPGLGTWCYPLDMSEETHGSWLEIDFETLVIPQPDTLREPFFIDAGVVKTDPDSWGIGAWDCFFEEPYRSLKFYEENGTSGNPGWHIRSFDWDIYAVLEYVEDIPPFIEDITVLSITVSQGPREVSATITDVDPMGGGNEGVKEALLWYSFNGVEAQSVPMEANVDTYSAQIPGGSPGDEIEYWITATDNAGLTSESSHYTYSIFQPVEPNLFINNTVFPDWIDTYYLFGVGLRGGEWPHDVWNGSYGAGTYALFSHYRTIVDAQGGGPLMCSDGLDKWLDEGSHNYLITGDEYLGECFYGWPGPMEIPEGHFAHDYLGLNFYTPDINYRATGDQRGVSRILPVENDPISGELFDFLGDSLYLIYDPLYEIAEDNWLDGVGVVENANVPFWGLTGVLDSAFQAPPGADTLPVASYLELTNRSKTAFFGFDALSLNTVDPTADTLHGAGYHWIGIHPLGPIPETLRMWEIFAVEGVPETVPSRFAFHPNTPNPFNPVTTLRYDLPMEGRVDLVIYDILGRQVRELVGERRSPGSHFSVWDGTSDAGIPAGSGIYFARLNVRADGSSYSTTRKMILLR